MSDTIVDKLTHIVADELDVNISLNELSGETALFEEGIGLDSVSIMEFISLIEKNFDFQFADDELNLSPFQNLNTLAEFINGKIQ